MDNVEVLYEKKFSEKAILNYWKMKNMSTSEYESNLSISAWAEWDKITDARDD